MRLMFEGVDELSMLLAELSVFPERITPGVVEPSRHDSCLGKLTVPVGLRVE